MADSLQSLIRSLPDSFTGQAAADFTQSVATQIREQAPSLQGPTNWFDFGEGSKIYSVERIIQAANELQLYGQELADKGGVYKNASYEKNKLISLLGNVYGLVGARVAVNATLERAQADLPGDIADQAKKVVAGIADYSKWIVVGVVAILGIYLLNRFSK